MELLFTPSVDQDAPALFLRQIAKTDPRVRLPDNLCLLPSHSPELNRADKLRDLVKDRTFNQLFEKHPALEEAMFVKIASLRECGENVAFLIGQGWLLDKVNSGPPPLRLIAKGNW